MWRKELEDDPEESFPGMGHQKPLEEENRRLRRELEIAREERDILKKQSLSFPPSNEPTSLYQL